MGELFVGGFSTLLSTTVVGYYTFFGFIQHGQPIENSILATSLVAIGNMTFGILLTMGAAKHPPSRKK